MQKAIVKPVSKIKRTINIITGVSSGIMIFPFRIGFQKLAGNTASVRHDRSRRSSNCRLYEPESCLSQVYIAEQSRQSEHDQNKHACEQ